MRCIRVCTLAGHCPQAHVGGSPCIHVHVAGDEIHSGKIAAVIWKLSPLYTDWETGPPPSPFMKEVTPLEGQRQA